jgi:hypothetical protein
MPEAPLSISPSHPFRLRLNANDGHIDRATKSAR